MCVYIYIYIHICIYLHIYLYINTHTHTHTHRWASLVPQLVKNLSAMEGPRLDLCIGKIHWRREGHPLQHSGLEMPWTVWILKELDMTE